MEPSSEAKNPTTNYLCDQSLFKCDICCALFLTRKSAAEHITSRHVRSKTSMNRNEKKPFNYEVTQDNADTRSETTFGYKKFAIKILMTLKCRLCDKVLENPKLVKEHIRTHKFDDWFQCLYCNYIIETERNVYKHIKRFHIRNEIYTCSTCGKKFRYKAKMLLHMKRHKAYSCTQCNQQFWLISELNKHVGDVHCDIELKNYSVAIEETNSGNKSSVENVFMPQNCRLCEKVLNDFSQVKLHLHKHKVNGRFQCLFCNSVIKATNDMAKHMRRFHMLHTEVYTCNICGKTFRRKSEMIIHIKRHKETKSYSCSQCSRKFAVSYDLTQHIRNVHGEEKPYECDICKTKFRTISFLKSHIGSSHIGLKYPCTICAKVFCTSHARQRHALKHIGIKKNRNRKSEIYPANAQHSCKLCGMVLSMRSALKLHLVTCHSNEQPFVCSKCDKSFFERKILQRHMRSVHNEEQFSCCECNKTLKTKSSLLIHMRNHSGELPYICECGKRFKRASNLNSHNRNFHSNDLFPCSICNKKFKSDLTLKRHSVKYHASR